MADRRRRYRRWVSCFDADLASLRHDAETAGMQYCGGGKPGMFVHWGLALSGTSRQMRLLEDKWRMAGYEFTNRPKSWMIQVPDSWFGAPASDPGLLAAIPIEALTPNGAQEEETNG